MRETPADVAIKGLRGITVSLKDMDSQGEFMELAFGGRRTKTDGAFTRYEMGVGGAGCIVDYVREPDVPQGSWAYGAIVFLLSVLIYERVSVYEEEFLIGKFGDAHRDWAQRVPMLWPRLTGWVTPKYKFWWKRMIWRERQKVFLLGTAVFFNWFARMDFQLSAIPADMWGWVYAYAALAAAFALTEVMGLFGYYKDMR